MRKQLPRLARRACWSALVLVLGASACEPAPGSKDAAAAGRDARTNAVGLSDTPAPTIAPESAAGSLQAQEAAPEAEQQSALEHDRRRDPALPFPGSEVESLEQENWRTRPHLDVEQRSEQFLVLDPSAPVEGDLVALWFPQPAWEDRCRLLRRSGPRDEDGLPTVLLTLDAEAKPCGLKPDLTWLPAPGQPSNFFRRVRLGRLPAGRYRIVAGRHTRVVEVKPAGTPPGPFPLEKWVALSVARAFRFAQRRWDQVSWFGLYYHAQESPITVRRLTRLWPDLSQNHSFALWDDATFLTPEPILGGYSFKLEPDFVGADDSYQGRILEVRVADGPSEARKLVSFRLLRARWRTGEPGYWSVPPPVVLPCSPKVALQVVELRGARLAHGERGALQRTLCSCYVQSLRSQSTLLGKLQWRTEVPTLPHAQRTRVDAAGPRLRELASCVKTYAPGHSFVRRGPAESEPGLVHIQLSFSARCDAQGWSALTDTCL